jgi:hypothetical protein
MASIALQIKSRVASENVGKILALERMLSVRSEHPPALPVIAHVSEHGNEGEAKLFSVLEFGIKL